MDQGVMFADDDAAALAHDAGGKVKIRLKPGVMGAAEFSPCQRYRYKLSRTWNPNLPAIMFCMMNPSTADAERFDDPTVAKCQRIAARLGMGMVWVGNSCAYRATDNKRLLTVEDPVGPENHRALLEMAAASVMIVVAHGRLPGGLQVHAEAMCRLLRLRAGRELHVLRLTPDGVPVHPMALGKSFIPDDTVPIPWNFTERP